MRKLLASASSSATSSSVISSLYLVVSFLRRRLTPPRDRTRERLRVSSGYHAHHTRSAHRLGAIDGTDARMGVRASQNRGGMRILERQIGAQDIVEQPVEEFERYLRSGRRL